MRASTTRVRVLRDLAAAGISLDDDHRRAADGRRRGVHRSRSSEITRDDARRRPTRSGARPARREVRARRATSDAVDAARARARSRPARRAHLAPRRHVLGRRCRPPGVGRRTASAGSTSPIDMRARVARDRGVRRAKCATTGFTRRRRARHGRQFARAGGARQSIADRAPSGHARASTCSTRTDPATIARRRDAHRPRRARCSSSRRSPARRSRRSRSSRTSTSSSRREAERRRRELRRDHRRRHAARRRSRREHGFRRVFINPGDIGGRYSALSYFGLVAGRRRRRRRRAACSSAASPRRSGRATPESERCGSARRSASSRWPGATSARSSSRRRIASFGLWVEQLIAESTGKEGRGILPVDGEPLGAPAHYGDDRVFVQLRLDGDDNGGDTTRIDRRARWPRASRHRHRARRRRTTSAASSSAGSSPSPSPARSSASTRSTSRTCRSRRTTPTACSRSSKRPARSIDDSTPSDRSRRIRPSRSLQAHRRAARAPPAATSPSRRTSSATADGDAAFGDDARGASATHVASRRRSATARGSCTRPASSTRAARPSGVFLQVHGDRRRRDVADSRAPVHVRPAQARAGDRRLRVARQRTGARSCACISAPTSTAGSRRSRGAIATRGCGRRAGREVARWTSAWSGSAAWART